MTVQLFEPGQIVYSEQSFNLTHVSFHLVVRTSAHSVWLRPIGKTEELLDGGQGTVMPDIQRQALDSSIFRMKIQKDDDGSHCAFDRFRVYRIFDGVAKYVNHWD